MKIKEGLFLVFIILLIYFTILLISMSVFDKNRESVFYLENGYKIIRANNISRLINDRDYYIYPENFPHEQIYQYSQQENVLLLECKSFKHEDEKDYFIIDMNTDEIIGPLDEGKFLEKLKDYITADYLAWSLVEK